MTPQPKESPDEILARRIERVRRLVEDGNGKGIPMPQSEQYLAMLEAMRDSRFSLKVLADIADCYDTQERPLRPTYVLHEAFNAKTGEWSKLTVADCTAARVLLRQSDDAIRGMRG